MKNPNNSLEDYKKIKEECEACCTIGGKRAKECPDSRKPDCGRLVFNIGKTYKEIIAILALNNPKDDK